MMYLISPFFHYNFKILSEEIKKLELKKFVKSRFSITLVFQVRRVQILSLISHSKTYGVKKSLLKTVNSKVEIGCMC